MLTLNYPKKVVTHFELITTWQLCCLLIYWIHEADQANHYRKMQIREGSRSCSFRPKNRKKQKKQQTHDGIKKIYRAYHQYKSIQYLAVNCLITTIYRTLPFNI